MRRLTTDFVRRVNESYERIASTQDFLGETELAHLRVLVRLSAEFALYVDLADPDGEETAYVCESIFSGVDSFDFMVRCVQEILSDGRTSQVAVPVESIGALFGQFRNLDARLPTLEYFPDILRVVLDMFKLQLVFAGLVF